MINFKKMFVGPMEPLEKLVWLQRRETWAGDLKANQIRWMALVVFGLNECLTYYGFHSVDRRFHIGSLLIVFLWLLCAGLFQWMLRQHFWPRKIPFLMISVDLLWITWLLFLADGPQSPLVCIYFLIIALSGLRLQAALCLYSAMGAMMGYLAVLQYVKLHAHQFMVSRSHETVTILSMMVMGAIMAHLVSRVLTLLQDSPERASPSKG